jgi:uncharacterized protein
VTSSSRDPVALRRRRTRLAIGMAGLLAVWNNLVHLHPVVGGVGYIPVNLALTVGLLVAGHAAGLDRAALGLARRRLGPSLLAGAAVVGVVALGLAIALLVPALRPLLEDGRFADRSTAGITWHALVRVPFGTALLEEVAFRGVLLGLLATLVGTRRAVVLSSLLFGLWHVRPAWGMAVANGADLGVGLASVAGSVVVTAIAGVAFCWLRLRTGHLAAPVVAHAGMNALATFAAHLALTWDS